MMKWETPLMAQNATTEDMIRFVGDYFHLSEEQINQMYTEWALSAKEIDRFVNDFTMED